MWIHKLVHPIALQILKRIHGLNVHILNDAPVTDSGVIYMANHSCKWDFPVAASVITKHVYVLVGKQPLFFSDWMGFQINGTIWVDRKDKTDRKNCYEKMKQMLFRDNRILIFPEGTWNLTESIPMLPIYRGGVKLAIDTGKPIITIAMEYVDKNCYVMFGEKIYVSLNEDCNEVTTKVRDRFATLRWYIWEQLPFVTRAEIDSEMWNREKKRRLQEYPKLDYEYEKSVVLSKN